MDYSLLVAVKLEKEASKYFFESETQLEAGFSIGIIDFLQQYDRKKKFESISKKILTMRPRSEISSINPKDYKIRFFNFVNGIITTNGKNKDSYFDLY
jgi:Phosphatidylinositol-4-phosphate 5-kinase